MMDLKRKRARNSFESDHIVLCDCDGKELEIFWLLHEVVLLAPNCNNFKFSKQNNPEVCAVLFELAKVIEAEDKKAGGFFVKDGSFVWHNMSRAWDRPFEEEAGFVASFDENDAKICFFPAKNSLLPKIDEFFVSMGGPDGYVEPYQSISNLFALALNDLLAKVPFEDEWKKQ